MTILANMSQRWNTKTAMGRLRWEDCAKGDLVGEGGKNKSEGYGSGDGSETGKWQEKEKKFMTSIDASINFFK